MISYIIRRLMLMIPTLFGITIMVFAIVRCSPGSPGSAQFEGGQMSAEQQKAVREYYDKKLGLDKPPWVQYGRWWRSMFTLETQGLAWTSDKPAREIFTPRRPLLEYYAKMPDGRWYAAVISEKSWRVEAVVAQDDPQFQAINISSEFEDVVPTIDPGYATPRHALVSVDLQAIESLPMDNLEPVRLTTFDPIMIDTQTWVDMGAYSGFPIYELRDEAATLLVYQRDGQWFSLEPQGTTTLALDDSTESRLRKVLGSVVDDLPGAKDEYALPRHDLVRGEPEPIDPPDESKLTRWVDQVEAQVPTMLWVSTASGDARVPLFHQKDVLPILLVHAPDGSWQRLIGDNRTVVPDTQQFKQSDEELHEHLTATQLDAFEEIDPGERVPDHVIMDGQYVATDMAVDERALRRYSHAFERFEVTLGTSQTSHTTVMEELKRRLPVTLSISLIAFPLIYIIAIPTGMLMAIRRGGGFDTLSNVALLGLWSIPVVLSGTLLIGYLGQGGDGVEWFPTAKLSSVGADSYPFSQWLRDRIWHMVLPVACIVYGGCAYLAKQMRAAMLDNFTMDYVRTARAKGVASKDVIFRHVLRNSLLPIITIVATILPFLIAGSIIIEKIFDIEGMGLFAFRAVQNRDYDVIQALALIAGILNLTGLLLADICYAMADPRITYK